MITISTSSHLFLRIFGVFEVLLGTLDVDLVSPTAKAHQ